MNGRPYVFAALLLALTVTPTYVGVCWRACFVEPIPNDARQTWSPSLNAPVSKRDRLRRQRLKFDRPLVRSVWSEANLRCRDWNSHWIHPRHLRPLSRPPRYWQSSPSYQSWLFHQCRAIQFQTSRPYYHYRRDKNARTQMLYACLATLQ